MTPSHAFQSLLWLVAIVALIPLALWLLKRTPLGQGGQAHGLRVVSALALSTTQRIVTVEVGHGDERRWLVLGVTPQAINTLHTLLPELQGPETQAPLASPEAAFAQLLGRLRPGGKAQH